MSLDLKHNYKNVEPRDLSDKDIEFLKNWIGNSMTEEQVKEHIYKIHSEITSEIHVYRCISILSYLSPKLQKYPIYADIITQAKLLGSNFRILDTGTCFGQEARGLLVDGVPPESIYVTDLHDIYWNAGLQLYKESNSSFSVTKVNTFFGNIATPFSTSNQNDIASRMIDTFDVVLNMAVLHVVTEEESFNILSRIYYMLKPNGVVFGYAVGASVARPWGLTPTNSGQRFLHDKSTLEATLQRGGFQDISVTSQSVPPTDSKVSAADDDGIEKVYLVFTAKK